MNRFKVIFYLLFLAVFAGCSKSDIEPNPPTPDPDKPVIPPVSSDSVIVSFKLGGDFKYSEEDMSRSTSNDLYAVRVYQSQNELTTLDVLTKVTLYATGYFDTPSNVVLKLAKNRYYHFEMAYIPNATNLIHQFPEGHYGLPFHAPYSDKKLQINEFLYTTVQEDGIWATAASQGKGISNYRVQENDFNTIERYQGLLWNFTPDQSEVKINLYKMMVGLKLIVNDFTEGSIILQSVHGHKYTLKPASEGTTNTLDVTVCLMSLPQIIDAHLFLNLDEQTDEAFREMIKREKPFGDESTGNLQIHYVDKDGDDIVLYNNQSFIFKRNKRHVLEFSVSDAIENGMLSPNVVNEGDEMEETGWDM